VSRDLEAEAPALPGPGDTEAQEGVALIRERCDLVPDAALVLGSGLASSVGPELDPCHEFAFATLPGFPPPSVPGHAGKLAMGHLHGTPVAVFFGRIHYYEGHGIVAATLVSRLCAGLGARTMILTNAAGGLRPELEPGQLMLIRDHINFQGVNPLTGWRLPDGSPAFVDLSAVYPPGLREAAERSARAAGVHVGTGVYVGMSGPSYETPAEIRMLRTAGADLVGMSTVMEAIAACHLGAEVLGISMVSNPAAGLTDEPIDHQAVLTATGASAAQVGALLSDLLPHI
jgi:purine-nucleoside phosphorylase